ncbi:hypothetical protein RsoM2USA_401 [Ralstonia phage RsoM2USA]|nr:hypothetical protein RsoM2USA_401 [Ralstonia phage RsoM2USA]
MSEILSTTISDLIEESRRISPTFERISPTSAKISWVYPSTFRTLNGVLVLLSDSAFNPSNYPTDTVRYTPSTVFSSPADKIGAAVVVGAFYNDVTTLSVTVTGLDPAVIYYASVHGVSNVIQYYQNGVQTYPIEVDVDPYTGNIPESETPPANPTLGTVYYNKFNNQVLMWTGSMWVQASAGTVLTGTQFPVAGTDGEFFYHTNRRILYICNAGQWTEANTADRGQQMQNKKDIGTDTSYDARLQLINILKAQLGWPSMCVELNENQFDVAIDNAIQELRRRTDVAYRRRYIIMRLQPAQEVYYLNDPTVGTTKVTEVLKIHRTNYFGVLTSGDNAIYSQVIFNNLFNNGSDTNLVSIHLLAAYGNEFTKLFAGELQFNWDETTRELYVHRKVAGNEPVVLEVSMERTEQELLIDRWTTQWIQAWALSECKYMLGIIRTKYANLPGANGGISMNGDMLIQEANTDQQECLRQIANYEVGNGGSEFGNWTFTMG